MKKASVVLVAALLIGSAAHGGGVSAFNVDTAPNVYGSPNWAPWWDAAKTDVTSGAFTNMRSSVLGTPGDLYMDPYDEIVYSTGDLGSRLHWIYWLEDTTIADLDGLFEVRYVYDWNGVEYSSSWTQPGRWTEYNNGVIGSFGFAFWAQDDYAPPLSTNGSGTDETDQADIDALRDWALDYQTFARGEIRFRDSLAADWMTQALQVNIMQPVPVPAAAPLALLGLGLVGAVRRMRKS